MFCRPVRHILDFTLPTNYILDEQNIHLPDFASSDILDIFGVLKYVEYGHTYSAINPGFVISWPLYWILNYFPAMS